MTRARHPNRNPQQNKSGRGKVKHLSNDNHFWYLINYLLPFSIFIAHIIFSRSL